jgi:hypothetical protein
MHDPHVTTAPTPHPDPTADGPRGPRRVDTPFDTPAGASHHVHHRTDRPVGRDVMREGLRLVQRVVPRTPDATTPRPRAPLPRTALARPAAGTTAGPARVRRDAIPTVAEAEAALVHRLGHLRATVARYVRARRAEGATFARVLAEVQDLVDLACVREGWADSDDALLAAAARWAAAAYAARREQPRITPAPRLERAD